MDEYTDELAQIIREVDGNHDLGSGELAEKIIESGFLERVVRDYEGVVEMNDGRTLGLGGFLQDYFKEK